MSKKKTVILGIAACSMLLVLFACQKQQPGAESPLMQTQAPPQIIPNKISMQLTSPAFENGKDIPASYTCDGQDINPALNISDVPAEAKSLALVVDDPDAPVGDWVHWLIWNIDPGTKLIAENSTPAGSVAGTTDFGKPGWGGPCPPNGVHRYFFKLYALDTILSLPESTKKAGLEEAMKGHILVQSALIGKYMR